MKHQFKKGKIISFRPSTCWGVVEVSGEEYDFFSTCFAAIQKPRFPRAGEEVGVVLNPKGMGLTVQIMVSKAP
jgi:hypothetical protein